MAIKGKGKTRRRTVAAGPKPVYVEPPKPPWRRRWVQLTALAVLIVGIAAGVMVALTHLGNVHQQQRAAARKAKEAAIVNQYGSQVDSAVQAVSHRFQDSRTPFPELTQSASKAKPGQPFDSRSLAVFRATVKLAGFAQTNVQKIPGATLISGHPDLLPLLDTQNDLEQSIAVYQQAASSLLAADKVNGSARTALMTQAKNLLPIGASMFSNGYQKLINLRGQLGIQLPAQGPPQRAIPTPAVSATPSAKASGTTAPSASPKKHKKKR